MTDTSFNKGRYNNYIDGDIPDLLYLIKALYGFEPRYNREDNICKEDKSKGILKVSNRVHHKFKSPILLLFKDNIEIK